MGRPSKEGSKTQSSVSTLSSSFECGICDVVNICKVECYISILPFLEEVLAIEFMLKLHRRKYVSDVRNIINTILN